MTAHDGALYIFVVERTPKLRDLLRDGRYALHTFPSLPRRTLDSYVDDELVITGRAVVVDDADRRAAVVAVHNDTVHETDVLFELDVESAQHKSRAKGRPVYRRWTG